MTYQTRNNSNARTFALDRLHVLTAVFFLLGAAIIGRLFQLQVLHGSAQQVEAFNQRALFQELLPRRGAVFAQTSLAGDELQPIAINEQRSLLYAVPSEIQNPEPILTALDPLLFSELEEEYQQTEYARVHALLSKENDPYEPLAHGVPNDQAREVLDQGLPGIYAQPETVRTYPLGTSFSHVTGFLGFSADGRIGQYGIEDHFDTLLSGTGGFLESEQDPHGRMIVVADREYIPAENGADVILTIDTNIQQKSCELIKGAVETYQATGGSIIVLEPTTGAIKAVCNFPTFNPNEYGDVEDIDVYVNNAISSSYEPGSIFKPITMAAALDSGSVEVDTEYTDTGEVTIGEHTIRNADNKIFGTQNMSGVLENSINTGTVFAAMQTGRRTFRDYVHKFGFGKQTGVELPVEARGDISSLDRDGEIYLATGSFGQGITATPLQMVQAFGAIANQGKLHHPYIVTETRFSDGSVVVHQPSEPRKVISTQTAAILSAMLVNVVEKGHGSSAQVPGFYLAGKTGTAQIAGEKGYSEDTIHSFVGFGPISEPKFVALVKIDRPQWGRFSSNTVVPVFGELANYLLQYYQVPPER